MNHTSPTIFKSFNCYVFIIINEEIVVEHNIDPVKKKLAQYKQ